MSIKVCDAIMGSGKSSAAIRYMNDHPTRKFIYVTPYLAEVKRISDSCPALRFKEPRNDLPEFGFKKYRHTLDLIASGENITTTHKMFLRYTDDLVDKIREHGYTLIIDEAVDVLYPASIKPVDFQMLKDLGWLTKENGVIKITPSFKYEDGLFEDIIALAKGNRLIEMEDQETAGKLYYWLFSQELLTAFSDVYILTYLFDAQMMKYGLDLMGLEYEKIGIHRDERGGYHFCSHPDYVPEYTATLSQKIHIFDNDKINAIGEAVHALSHTWYSKDGSDELVDKLRRHVRNFFMEYNEDKPAERRLWATYKNGEGKVRGKGYYRSNLAFNAKATNDYRDKDVLAYCVNVFMNPNEKNYLIRNGINVKEDEYALSVMIQWIWRSAIREGGEIWIYIPSKRMRDLLENWISWVEGKAPKSVADKEPKPKQNKYIRKDQLTKADRRKIRKVIKNNE